MGAPLPTIGAGEQVHIAVGRLEGAVRRWSCSTVAIPSGSSRARTCSPPWRRDRRRRGPGPGTCVGSGSRRVPSTAGAGPTPPPVRSPRRCTWRRRSQQDAVGMDRGFDYGRSGNPSRASLEAHLAMLEGAEFGFAFASGMAAEDAILRLLDPGDHLVMPTDSYGGTYRLATQVHRRAGLGRGRHRPVPVGRGPLAPRRAWSGSRHRPTPSSTIVDIAAVAYARPRPWCAGGRRQHLRHPLAPAAAHARGRSRGPLDHQVPGRALRCHRWVRGPRTTCRAPSGWGSSRTRPGRSRALSTATWSSAAS